MQLGLREFFSNQRKEVTTASFLMFSNVHVMLTVLSKPYGGEM